MPFDIKDIIREAKKNYEKAWLKSRDLLKLKGNFFNLQKKGKSHPVSDFIDNAKKKIVKLGFEELILPMFVEEEDIYKQYGPEAVLILDRLFYLAGLPRPDIGISNEKVEKIQNIISNFEKIKELKQIFREYKIGEIEADDLIEVFVERLKIKENQATEIIDKIFPELKDLKPIPTKTTLRSHTTALWFKVLSELKKKKPLPLQYFSIAKKFRREQKIDSTHLYDSYTLSLVVMAEPISLEDCQKIALELCEQLGFSSSKVEIKKATSKYYAPQTEFEIFVEHPKSKEWIEIGDGGFYSPVSLAQYDIEYPVFNIGFGIERICMIKTEIDDIRKLVYPYYYENISFTDKEISKGVHYKFIPLTEKGIEIKNAIIKTAKENKDKISPIELKVWEGTIKNKKIEVSIWENDKDVKLLGPAALNKVYISDGAVLGISPEKIDLHEKIIDTGITYLEGIASEMAYNIEIFLDQNKDTYEHRVKMCYRGSEVNIELDDRILEYIQSKQKKFDIRGPVFVGLSYKTIN
ncbi:MAG: O-phosphoserine--tRNA ligase [Candidatus Lokiarchaeota archaeon]|nr:O-phosphoserine--tRNA ligase [Candidatus Lokiarchaeota archaeon]